MRTLIGIIALPILYVLALCKRPGNKQGLPPSAGCPVNSTACPSSTGSGCTDHSCSIWRKAGRKK